MSELSDLVGLMMLDAVDFETTNIPIFEGSEEMETANVCRFRLNGQVYAAVENPSDGYRSSMRELQAVRGEMTNVFPATQVLGIYRARSRNGYDKADILELYDVKTAKMVLEVGTDNTDDYYPSFVSNFSPENLAVNSAA